jgi:hypothetical protein
VIYVDFDYATNVGEYDNGTLYVVSDENDNVGNTYNIVHNTSSSITVNGKIVPRSTFYGADLSGNTSIIVGQKISLLDSTNRMVLYVAFDSKIKNNQLAGSNITLLGSTSLAASIKNLEIYSHTEDKIVLKTFSSDFSLPIGFSVADRFAIRGHTFDKLSGFDSKITSVESGHYHNLNLVGGFIYGEVNSFVLTGKGVEMEVINVSGWKDILDIDSELMKGAIILFYNPNQVGVSYTAKIIEATEFQFIISTEKSSMWDNLAYNSNKISTGWKWEIDATYYGYTEQTYYSDFIFEIQSVIENIINGSVIIKVEDSTNMVIDDKISIVDGYGTRETHYISQVTDINTIVIDSAVNSSFFINQNARVEVLRDTFSNNHIHSVKLNEVEEILVLDYNEKGYPSVHNHRCLPYLNTVNDIIIGDKLIAIGSDSKVYKSYNNGSSWLRMTDLNKAIEGGEEIPSISCGASYTGKLIVGTTNGYMFSELESQGVVKLEKPSV